MVTNCNQLKMFADATTTELSKVHNPQDFKENKKIAKRGGSVAGEARKSIEADTGKPVITKQTAIDFTQVIDLLEEANNDDK